LVEDLAKHFAGLIDPTFDASAARIALFDAFVDVKGDDLDRKAARRPAGHAAHRAGVRIEIEQRHIAFRRGVKLEDVANCKARLKGQEDVGPQAVADTQTDAMGAVSVAGRRIEEIAAQFADIGEHRAVMIDRVVPELTRRETVAYETGGADRKRDADRDDAAICVIHRQTIVHAIPMARVGRRGEAQHDAQRAGMGDARRLGQARRPRGVDE